MSRPEHAPPAGATPADAAHRRRGLLIGVITLVAAVVLGSVWLLSRDQENAAVEGPDTTGTPTPAATTPSEDTPTAAPSASTDGSPSASTTQGPTATDASSTRPTSPRPSAVTSAPIETKEPVELDETAEFGDGVTATLGGLIAVQGQAQGIGEVAGPALLFTVTVRNGTDEPLNLDNAVVDVAYGEDNTPGIPLLGDPSSRPLSGTVAPGASAQGAYVFAVPIEGRSTVKVTVSHESLSPIVVFTGAAPR